ncbi:MAG: DUF5119 domain-containing protein [Mucinivorans sp.]
MKRQSSKHINNLAAKIILTVVCLCVCACAKTKVEPPSISSSTFSIEWPTGKADPAQGKTGSIYLYPATGGVPIILTGVSNKSASIELSAGDYNVIVYNENISRIKLRNSDSYNDFEAYLPPIAPKSAKGPAFIDQADYLYLLTGNTRQIKVIGGEVHNYALRPQAATQTIRFSVRISTTIAFSDIKATLSGVSSHLNLRSAKAVPVDISFIAVPFTLNTYTKGGLNAVGQIETFGVNPEGLPEKQNILTLDLTPLTPSSTIVTHYEEDLSAKLNEFSNVNLNVDVEIIDPVNPESKELVISITVKEWEQEDGGNIEINPANTQKQSTN